MKRLCPTFLIALSLCAQAPPQPGRSLDVREAPKRKEELERARKARARFEALRQAKAEELTRAYAREQQRQADLKADKAPTTGVLVLGGAPAVAPATPTPSAPPMATPRTPEALLAVLRSHALPRDADGNLWEVASFDGRTLVLDQTGGNYRKRFRVPLAEVSLALSRTFVQGAWRDLDAITLRSPKWQIPVTTLYTYGGASELMDNIVVLPMREPRAVLEMLRQYLAQASTKP